VDLDGDLVPVGAGCPRSDILLPASHPRRLSRAIRTPVRTKFSHHLMALDAVGMRIEQAINRPWNDRKTSTLWSAA
jgi:hypothetical protein